MKHVDAYHILCVLKKEKEEGRGEEDNWKQLKRDSMDFDKYIIYISMDNYTHMKKDSVDCSVFIDMK